MLQHHEEDHSDDVLLGWGRVGRPWDSQVDSMAEMFAKDIDSVLGRVSEILGISRDIPPGFTVGQALQTEGKFAVSLRRRLIAGRFTFIGEFTPRDRVGSDPLVTFRGWYLLDREPTRFHAESGTRILFELGARELEALPSAKLHVDYLLKNDIEAEARRKMLDRLSQTREGM